ncbi:ATP-dependent DNA ligase [Candidatus Woesearchaeota archaeon]|nr:ATP-dependent DNA ligase [Candidatus Woesearchaeota archaeon]
MKYKELCEVYGALEGTTKRLEKIELIAALLKKTKAEDMEKTVLLLQGSIYPAWDERKIGVASRLIIKAINTSSGISVKKIEEEWKKTGDLGKVAENLVKRKKQVTLFEKKLTVSDVFNNLRKLSELEGEGTVNRKLGLINQLLTSAEPLEARYIIRTVLEELRVGVGDGSIRDAIVCAFFPETKEMKDSDRERYALFVNAVQHAYDVANDFGAVARAALAHGLNGLEKISMAVGQPIKVMLAQKVRDVSEGFERVGKPAQLEYKYDGFRTQIHKHNNRITLFTRKLENVTNQFPEIIDYVGKHVKGNSFILDAETVGFDPKTGKYMPFQSISQRIRRKYSIGELSKKLPVEVNVFDMLFHDGKSFLKEAFSERRKLIEKIIDEKPRQIIVARSIITDDVQEAESFYRESLAKGNEGIMMKNLDAPYKPGSRVGFMVKLKPIMDTLDLVIVGAEWGEGKRASWLTSFTVACINDDNEFLEIGKVGTGIKELEGEGTTFMQLTELLKPLIISEKGREVTIKPRIVIEISYEEIQKSPTYSSGFALRFPRLVNLREERNPREISTIDEVEELYFGQRG